MTYPRDCGTVEYYDPRAAEWVAKCLIEWRDKIGRAFFEELLPLDSFKMSGGKLCFDDLAARYSFREAPVYSVQWFEYDNLTSARTPISAAATFDVPRTQAPYLAAAIQAGDPRKTVTVYVSDDCVVRFDRTW
jgi:hypothetical protein